MFKSDFQIVNHRLLIKLTRFQSKQFPFLLLNSKCWDELENVRREVHKIVWSKKVKLCRTCLTYLHTSKARAWSKNGIPCQLKAWKANTSLKHFIVSKSDWFAKCSHCGVSALIRTFLTSSCWVRTAENCRQIGKSN